MEIPMNRLFSYFVLSASALASLSAPARLFPQGDPGAPIGGIWQGFATVAGSVQVPVTIRISGAGANLKASFLNGPAEHPDTTPASSVTFNGTHLVVSFDYFARKFEADLVGRTLTGTYGTAVASSLSKAAAPIPVTLNHVDRVTDPAAATNAPSISGSWEIATQSAKGESAWEFRVDPPLHDSPVIKTVIQRIDGDTGGLWGTWTGTSYTVGHFTAAGPALYAVTPASDGTLAVKSLLPPVHGPAPATWIARRPAEARKLNLLAPTDPSQQTTVKEPNAPFTFSFPDVTGKTVSNTDPRFRGKVVIIAIGGSWCPNCHDEAPFLVSLYRKFHPLGLEIVNLDFEQGDPATDTKRLQSFIAHYGITYPVLLAGTTDQLNEKIPQGVNLNCWPTSFFIGRDGRVKRTHAGFAGPGNTAGHEALEHDVTALVETLLAQPAPRHTAELVR
ncbi:TlpA family protein disulfide reductase [Granulicella sp. WH15]|nr:TlpA family protein disulfide reductase [Granulicella sp. WH15]